MHYNIVIVQGSAEVQMIYDVPHFPQTGSMGIILSIASLTAVDMLPKQSDCSSK